MCAREEMTVRRGEAPTARYLLRERGKGAPHADSVQRVRAWVQCYKNSDVIRIRRAGTGYFGFAPLSRVAAWIA